MATNFTFSSKRWYNIPIQSHHSRQKKLHVVQIIIIIIKADSLRISLILTSSTLVTFFVWTKKNPWLLFLVKLCHFSSFPQFPFPSPPQSATVSVYKKSPVTASSSPPPRANWHPIFSSFFLQTTGSLLVNRFKKKTSPSFSWYIGLLTPPSGL